MDTSVTQPEAPAAIEEEARDQLTGLNGPVDPEHLMEKTGAMDWLDEIILRLDQYPDECWEALDGLASIDGEMRVSIIDGLSGFGTRPSVARLLRLLASARDVATRAAARAALAHASHEAPHDEGSHDSIEPPHEQAEPPGPSLERRELVRLAEPERLAPRLVSCLVTSVDGSGRGSIVVSVREARKRRTAAFLCDVQLGIRDVIGEVEPESSWAGGLIEAFEDEHEGTCVRDSPELAIGLLVGSLTLGARSVPEAVRDWLLGTLGPGIQPGDFPAVIPDIDDLAIPYHAMQARAVAVLEACPTWLDLSPLTFELAEEIWLREGTTSADSDRNAGAYRFLFERRIIDRLELYRRMLLWMAGLWRVSGEIELSRSAQILAYQLADEQYAVPSNPFTVELTRRSFRNCLKAKISE